MIASCISTGREGQWHEDDVVMVGDDGGDEVGGGGSSKSNRTGGGDLYMYVLSFVGKKQGDRLARDARGRAEKQSTPKFHGKVPLEIVSTDA